MRLNSPRITLLGIEIDNLSMKETLDKIEALINKRKPSFIITPNVHHIYILQKDEEFKTIYSQATLVLPDSTPLLWTSRLLGKPLKERVAGSDLLPFFCKRASQKGLRLFFLGSPLGIAKKTAEILTKKNPGLKISGTYAPPLGFENDDEENKKIVEMIRASDTDVLFVGLGPPKQEKWVWKYKDKLNVPVTICVGAAFDFIGGDVKRAPIWTRKIGLEWFFRFCQEPRRLWKRYIIGNSNFGWMVLKELIKR